MIILEPHRFRMYVGHGTIRSKVSFSRTNKIDKLRYLGPCATTRKKHAKL